LLYYYCTHFRYQNQDLSHIILAVVVFINVSELCYAIASEYTDPMEMYCRLAVLMAEKDPKLTQRSLSKELGLGLTTIGRLYNNNFERIDKNTVEVVCRYFNCGIGELFVMKDREGK